MVGIAKRLNDNIDFGGLVSDINNLYKNQEFIDSITRATSDDKVVEQRHRMFNEFIANYVQ